MAGFLKALTRDLEAPIEARGFGTGWFAGFFAILLGCVGLGMVLALRYPAWLGTPALAAVKNLEGFRPAIHAVILGSYALALISLILRPRKALGFTALILALIAGLLGGSGAEAREVHDWGIFFGLDFFVLNLVMTGLIFAPIERFLPHHAKQRLFRTEWREDLFYYLISSMMVQALTFLAFAPSKAVLSVSGGFAGFRALVGSQPLVLQVIEIMLLTDFVQYWFHRAFHRVPFLWGFHAVHHSAKAMDWLAGARMHFFEIAALRGVTAIPMMTLGYTPTALQIYIGLVYVYSSLLHANLRGDFDRLGRFVATPRFHHWHHGLEKEAVDVNFAIHFPFLDRVFGTYYYPAGRWPEGYGVPEKVPNGYVAQFLYPFRRKG
ncbi:sterol desaturase family protein [Flavisphingomonas formosensis]|uniref:sterol desaturase family protein n=1 Tax=Flavisphingomonas formosensis TaxID=861534 RepID=UPI0012FC6375|nr:sterol desaturase family protein [Sphingomonas formosensis]